jgi:hypothetical protein
MDKSGVELPGVLDDLAITFGFSTALALTRWRGGTRLYIPRTITNDHELVRRIGRPAAEWLSKTYATDYIDIPRAYDYMLCVRNAEIRRKHRLLNVTGPKLALEYGLTERQIWTILAGSDDEPTDNPQLDLI